MPTNALCSQRVAMLNNLLKPLNKEVGRAYAGLHSDFLNADTGVCVCVCVSMCVQAPLVAWFSLKGLLLGEESGGGFHERR